MSDQKKVFSIASALEEIGIEMEYLKNLLILYFEHREDEIGGVDPEQRQHSTGQIWALLY